jgi:hypothetical protein
MLIIGSFGIMTNPVNYFDTAIQFAYSQPNQVNSDSDIHSTGNTNIDTNILDVQNIPAKKVHVGDIDIAHKIFGKGEVFLLISGSGLVMDVWEPSILRDLASNHTVIIFDNRGLEILQLVKPFSIVHLQMIQLVYVMP